jgi:activating signal cointegrator 1
VRGLSLWEPWASLMRFDEKRFETRSWHTNYRGPIAIHASKNREELELALEEPFCSALIRHGVQKIGDLTLGAFVAVAYLRVCVPTGRSVYLPEIEKYRAEHEYSFGNYEPGRFAWHCANLRPLREPLHARGMQGLWTLDAETESKLLALSASPVDSQEKP